MKLLYIINNKNDFTCDFKYKLMINECKCIMKSERKNEVKF